MSLPIVLALVALCLCGGPVLYFSGGLARLTPVTETSTTVNNAEWAEWTGTYECGEATRGLVVRTRFNGQKSGESLGLDAVVNIHESVPASPGAKPAGKSRAGFKMAGSAANGQITLKPDARDSRHPDRIRSFTGTLDMAAVPAPTLIGTVEAESCTAFKLSSAPKNEAGSGAPTSGVPG